MILTDEEIFEFRESNHIAITLDDFRAIEAAIMAKFELLMFYECEGCGHINMERVTSCDCMSGLAINEKPLYALKEKP